MSRRMPLKILSLLLAVGLCANLVSQIGVSHAQQSGSGFDRTQISNDNPVGDLTEAFPQTGEVDVMIELVDAPTAKVFAQTLGNSRNSNSQQLAQAKGAHPVLRHQRGERRHGKATLNGVGNYSFIGRIIDNGESGSNDRFGLRVTDPSGNIVVDLTFDPLQLSGGNFSVPK